MIKFENITKIYSSNIVALDNVSFEVGTNEFVLIIGRSGAGKTTLLKLLLAEEKPSKGQVFFTNQNVNNLKAEELPRLRRQIGTIFQDYKLLSSKTAYENVAYAMEVIGADKKEIERDVSQVLDMVGLAERAQNFPRELSGGEKQRVAIARALIHRPKLIIADEPTANLDPYHTADIIRLLMKIQEMGTTIILASHNKEIINSLGKRTITMEDGRIVRDEEKGRFIL